MKHNIEQAELSPRELTIAEMDQVSGGARSFNPQPDPPGVMHNPPTYLTAAMVPPDPY